MVKNILLFIKLKNNFFMLNILLGMLNIILMVLLIRIKMKFLKMRQKQFIHVKIQLLKFINKLLMIKNLWFLIHKLLVNQVKKNLWDINLHKIWIN